MRHTRDLSPLARARTALERAQQALKARPTTEHAPIEDDYGDEAMP